MAEPYNHRAIEQKWRDKWEATPINVNDGNQNIIVLICSRIHQEADFM